ncbi:DnaJ domain-containing protein [Artemisia annua]|uniref:DnaJ domain-containing protein n=1 Tax=Artemisia annua TaxID=35608 RepID=A0A2U1PLQ1_ARTAN|nr:DnaJ domain-containing protein [Artemisia annua]
MNSKTLPCVTQSFLNSSNKLPISPLKPNLQFKLNKKTNVKIPQISFRTTKVTTKASFSAAGLAKPATENETLYELLGISESCTLSDIKQAYKKMALKYHPDVSPPERMEEYTTRFIRVQEAYETLSDPEARYMYDSCMSKGLHMAFSGKRPTRFDPDSADKIRWKEMWQVQISELIRRNKVNPNKAGRAQGMSWAARIRKQRVESC